jgi:hypothetical protein
MPSRDCSRCFIQQLPFCGGFVVNVTGRSSPVLEFLVADYQEIDCQIERSEKSIEPDNLGEPIGLLRFDDHDVEVAIGGSVAAGLRAEKNDLRKPDQWGCLG